jgi:MerR family transcriptional regulator, light-induced transcriptional regulator
VAFREPGAGPTDDGRQVATDTRDPGPAAGGLHIQQVSELLGVPAPTLRSWERRYGLPTTQRSSGGHRRYSEEALRQLRLMRDEVARGRRAADAARSVRVLLDPAGPGTARIDELLAASQRMEPAAIRAALDRAHDELGLAVTLDHVLMPAMRQIGAWWETGRCDVAQEHLTTEVARGWLARMVALAPAPSHERPVLLACGPRDLHTLGLEALAGLLTHRRRGCRVLGARTPERTLVTAAIATEAAAVVVVSHLATQRRPAVEALRAVAAIGCPVYYAGNAFLFPGARRGVPGDWLGDNLATAADVITAALTEG